MMVLAALVPDETIRKVRFLGKTLSKSVQDSVLSATISSSTSQVTELKITISDPGFSMLGKGLFALGIPVEYEDMTFVTTAIDTGENTAESVSISAQPRTVDRLRKRRGAFVMKGKSASDFVVSEAKSVGATAIVQPCARRSQVARDIPEKGQKYDTDQYPSSWTTFSRLAGEEGYVMYEYANTIYFGKPTWLLNRARQKPFIADWKSADPKLRPINAPSCSRSSTETSTSVSVSMPVMVAPNAYPGRAFQLKGVPTFNGYYLLDSVDYDLTTGANAVTIRATTPVDPEASDPGGKKAQADAAKGYVAPGKTTKTTGVGWLDDMLKGLLNFQQQNIDMLIKQREDEYNRAGGFAGYGPTGTGSSSLPIKGYGVTTPFGKRGSWNAGYHTGADYACPTGTPVYAVYDGVIDGANWGSAYGTAVALRVSGMGIFMYCHLSRKADRSYKIGSTVSAGDILGWSGATGNVTGPHLHLEFRVSPYRYATDSRDPVPQLMKKSGPVGGYTAGQEGSKSILAFVQFALNQTGDRYVYGAEASASNSNPSAFDCSELVEWAAHRAGLEMPDGSQNQQRYCKPITVTQGINTRGALLFKHTSTEAHVAISLGNGKTIEAANPRSGVGQFNANNRGWTAAGTIPGAYGYQIYKSNPLGNRLPTLPS